jgi:hypothetical protein
VLSQASLAVPLLALYEGSIIAVRIVEKRAAASKTTATPPPATPPPPAANPAEYGVYGAHGAAPKPTVTLRESGVSSTPQLPDSITDAPEYWIARFRGR